LPLSNLNTQQKQSATTTNKTNLIIASAGTGKTSTLVGRIAHILSNGTKPENILLLTFTNKASNEMINRVKSSYGDEVARQIVAGTFHSVSYKLLKAAGYNLVLKTPRELKNLFRSIYDKRKPPIAGSVSAYDAGYLFDIYSLYLNTGADGGFGDWVELKNKEHKIYCDMYEDLFDEFNQTKKDYGYIGFDDLLVYMIQHLQKTTIKFDEILVDEYQDTNPLQARLLDMFSFERLFCVGDFDQSIYAFNGSDIGIISSFTTRYKDARVYHLTKNYRSTASILNLATRVISNNDRVYGKKLEVTRTNTDIKPKLLVFDELYNQYEYIASNIAKSPTAHDNIAIIYRNNSTADGIEANLRDIGISSKRKGGRSFFDSKEIKMVLDILVLQIKPNDMMATIEVLQHGEGIGQSIAKEIFEALTLLGDGSVIDGLLRPNIGIKNPFKQKIQHNQQLGLFDEFVELGSIGKFKRLGFDEKFFSNSILKHPKLLPNGANFLYQFYRLSLELNRIKNPATAISYILQSEFFELFKEKLCKMRARQKDGSIDENILKTAMFKLNRKTGILKQLSYRHNDMHRFINSMVLGASELESGSGVSLMSIHASKGLEFDEVYIIDLMDGRFPNKTLISKGGSIEEERRLFYVAVTRAKDILYLSYAKYDRIKKQEFVFSRFLKEAGMC